MISALNTDSLKSDWRAGALFRSTVERSPHFFWQRQMTFLRRTERGESGWAQSQLEVCRGVWETYLPVHKREQDSQREQSQHRPPTHAVDAEGSLWSEADQINKHYIPPNLCHPGPTPFLGREMNCSPSLDRVTY